VTVLLLGEYALLSEPVVLLALTRYVWVTPVDGATCSYVATPPETEVSSEKAPPFCDASILVV
jgi:hypothetical protein